MNNDYRYEQEFHRYWNFSVFMHYLSIHCTRLADMVVERNVGIFFCTMLEEEAHPCT